MSRNGVDLAHFQALNSSNRVVAQPFKQSLNGHLLCIRTACPTPPHVAHRKGVCIFMRLLPTPSRDHAVSHLISEFHARRSRCSWLTCPIEVKGAVHAWIGSCCHAGSVMCTPQVMHAQTPGRYKYGCHACACTCICCCSLAQTGSGIRAGVQSRNGYI